MEAAPAPPVAFLSAPSFAALPWLRDTHTGTLWVPVYHAHRLLAVSWQAVVQWMTPRGQLAQLQAPRTERTRTIARAALAGVPASHLRMPAKSTRILLISERDLLHYLCQRYTQLPPQSLH